MRSVLLGLLAVAVLVVGVVLGVSLSDRVSGDESADDVVAKPEFGTAPVVRTDLIEREAFDATLEFRNRRTLAVALPGTVTAVAEEGGTLERGDAVIEVDGAPVILFYGERPAWRPLGDGSDPGADVEQLESNLAALGYPADDELVVDEEFDEITETAVEEWREDIGLTEGGTVELGRVVFVPGAARAGSVLTAVGDVIAPGVPVLEISDAEQEILLDLPVDRRDLAAEGDAVVVVLPDDVRTTGTIIEISRVVTQLPGPVEPEDVVEVRIRLDDPSLAGDVDRAPVEVELVADRAEDVLAVPVNSLLALAEGGYAVEVAEGESRRLVAVELGTFLDTLVEVTGDLGEGDLVVVPR